MQYMIYNKNVVVKTNSNYELQMVFKLTVEFKEVRITL